MLERHFTLDTTQKGTDHQLSLTPPELSQLVADVRQLENYLKFQPLSTTPSDESILKTMSQIQTISDQDRKHILQALKPQKERVILPCERECFEKLGKSLVYVSNLKTGHLVTEKDVNFKVSHPKGLLDGDYDCLMGKRLCTDVSFEMPVQWHHLV